MKSVFLTTIVAMFMADIACADPWSQFHIATNYRPWGNEENYNMEKAFQQAGLPDDGCWENGNPNLACVIGFERRDEEFTACGGKFSLFGIPIGSDCKTWNQMDYIILYRFDAKGYPGTKFTAAQRYVCKHPTGTDPWPRELCEVNRDLGGQTTDLLNNKLVQSPGLRELFQEKQMFK